MLFFKLSKQRVKIFASGRTDAGVHALGQVVHFDLDKEFEEHQIVSGLNNFLMKRNISVLKCEIVDEAFHSRFDAKERSYRYVIINRKSPLTLQKNLAWHVNLELDVKAMKLAASFLVGLHDFSSFRDRKCASKTSIRRVNDISIQKTGDEIHIEINAKSFLHHMVRNIVGTLVWVGLGKGNAENMKNILEARNRSKSGPNAPSCGLYFLKVDY